MVPNHQIVQSITYIFWSQCSIFVSSHSWIFHKLQSNFIEIALRHRYSPVNLLYVFKTPFLKNTSGWLLLIFISSRWVLSSPRWKIYPQVSHQKSFENFDVFSGKLRRPHLGPRLPLIAKWCAGVKVAPWDMVFLDFWLSSNTKN